MMNSMHELAVVWIWLITKKRGLTFAAFAVMLEDLRLDEPDSAVMLTKQGT